MRGGGRVRLWALAFVSDAVCWSRCGAVVRLSAVVVSASRRLGRLELVFVSAAVVAVAS